METVLEEYFSDANEIFNLITDEIVCKVRKGDGIVLLDKRGLPIISATLNEDRNLPVFHYGYILSKHIIAIPNSKDSVDNEIIKQVEERLKNTIPEENYEIDIEEGHYRIDVYGDKIQGNGNDEVDGFCEIIKKHTNGKSINHNNGIKLNVQQDNIMKVYNDISKFHNDDTAYYELENSVSGNKLQFVVNYVYNQDYFMRIVLNREDTLSSHYFLMKLNS